MLEFTAGDLSDYLPVLMSALNIDQQMNIDQHIRSRVTAALRSDVEAPFH